MVATGQPHLVWIRIPRPLPTKNATRLVGGLRDFTILEKFGIVVIVAAMPFFRLLLRPATPVHVAHPPGLEPGTRGLEIRCSIQLS